MTSILVKIGDMIGTTNEIHDHRVAVTIDIMDNEQAHVRTNEHVHGQQAENAVAHRIGLPDRLYQSIRVKRTSSKQEKPL